MFKNLEILLRSAELAHASEKLDFATKDFGAKKFGARQRIPLCAAVAHQLAAA